MTEEKELVLVSSDDRGVAELVFNDPESRNAMTEAMADAFAEAVYQICEFNPLRVVVIRGAGEVFSAGGDFAMLEAKQHLSERENRRSMKDFYGEFLSLLRIHVPVIAAINGHAVGAGLCVALACDMRIAVEDAKLGLTFTRLGLHPGMGATYFVPQLVGEGLAAELLLTGRTVTAREAASMGLVNAAVPEEEFEARISSIVEGVLSGGPRAVSELTETLRAARTRNLKRALEREAVIQAGDYLSEEFALGLEAARNKQKSPFS